MRASELIEELQKMIEEHGDLECLKEEYDGIYDIYTVNLENIGSEQYFVL